MERRTFDEPIDEELVAALVQQRNIRRTQMERVHNIPVMQTYAQDYATLLRVIPPNSSLRGLLEMLMIADEDEEEYEGELPELYELGAPIGLENLQDIIIGLLRHVAQDNVEDDDEPEVVEIGPRRRAAAREPYTVSIRLRQTNWMEKSLDFPNKWFRRVYRLVVAHVD
jgi:hypothetical protein